MPYHRTSEIPLPESLAKQFEQAIKNLVMKFREHPYVFYTETDMHCYLYHRLYCKPFTELHKTVDGNDTILLHKEYPTIARYQHQEKLLVESSNARKRGRFDISIWDPRYIGEHTHRKQRVLCAAELALNECGKRNCHTINDCTKLAGANNGVRYGYLLYFIRDSSQYNKYKDEIWQNLDNAAKKVRVVFTQVDTRLTQPKPKPIYLGDWGTF